MLLNGRAVQVLKSWFEYEKLSPLLRRKGSKSRYSSLRRRGGLEFAQSSSWLRDGRARESNATSSGAKPTR